MSQQAHAVKKLRQLLAGPDIIIMPCCYDALSAKLIQQSGFQLTFMSGFAVSAARLGLPDTGLISYAEMADQGRDICSAVTIPVIGDADTGYGNVVNIKRTVQGFAQTGFAGIMIEDQRSPKRCGHTRGKDVVERSEALQRIRAAVEARDETGDIIIMARTDARATHDLEEALERARQFSRLGADIVFVEAPQTEEEIRTICREIDGCLLINMVEHGKTPVLPPAVLQEMGFKIAAYPLTLLSASIYAMQETLRCLQNGETPEHILEFNQLQKVVGFPEYDATLQRLEGNDKKNSV